MVAAGGVWVCAGRRACVCECCAGLCGLLWESPTHTSLGALEGAREVYVNKVAVSVTSAFNCHSSCDVR